MKFVINPTQPVLIEAKLEGGHTLVASLWFDEDGPGWWHLEPSAVRPGETDWSVGPLGGRWTVNAQQQHEWEERAPHYPRNFGPPSPPGASQWFWLTLRAASNTNAPIKSAVVELIVSQNGVEIEPASGASAVVLSNKKGAKILVGYEYIEFALQ